MHMVPQPSWCTPSRLQVAAKLPTHKPCLAACRLPPSLRPELGCLPTAVQLLLAWTTLMALRQQRLLSYLVAMRLLCCPPPPAH